MHNTLSGHCSEAVGCEQKGKRMRTSHIALASIFVIFGCSQPDQTPPPKPAKGAATTPAKAASATAAPKKGATKTASAGSSEKMRSVELSALKWKEVPEAHGVQMAPVWKHDQTEASAFFVKFPAGWSHPSHFHPTNAQRIVVEGDFEVTVKDGATTGSKKGDHAYSPANVIHTSATKKGCTMFIVTEGKFGSITVGDDGKPTKATDPPPGPVSGESKAVAATELAWKDHPEAKGVKVAPVWNNETTGATAMFIKFDANVAHGAHTHTSSFHRVMIEGEMVVEANGETFTGGVGSYFRGVKDTVHTSGSKTGGTFFLLSDAKFGTVFVDEDGKPLPAKKTP
jgi:quercetin dioxygenase-like cupin family protein